MRRRLSSKPSGQWITWPRARHEARDRSSARTHPAARQCSRRCTCSTSTQRAGCTWPRMSLWTANRQSAARTGCRHRRNDRRTARAGVSAAASAAAASARAGASVAACRSKPNSRSGTGREAVRSRRPSGRHRSNFAACSHCSRCFGSRRSCQTRTGSCNSSASAAAHTRKRSVPGGRGRSTSSSAWWRGRTENCGEGGICFGKSSGYLGSRGPTKCYG